MSERISLTRIIAIHWYGFRQIFDVDENVLISGAFGTGKSALLTPHGCRRMTRQGHLEFAIRTFGSKEDR